METFKAFTDTGSFYEWLKGVYKGMTQRNYDFVLVIVGGERLGKTSLGIRIMYDFNKPQFVYNGSISICNISMNGEMYINDIVEKNRGNLIQFDEAVDGMYSRDAMSPRNKKINKKLMKCGFLNIFHILCLPNFKAIDNNIREHRVGALIKIVERGKYLAYSSAEAKKIAAKKGDFNAGKPSSKGWWPKSSEDDDYNELIKQYKKLELRYKLDHDEEIDKRNMIITKLYRRGGLTQQELADLFGITNQRINQILKTTK